jgi:hypothetical protein
MLLDVAWQLTRGGKRAFFSRPDTGANYSIKRGFCKEEMYQL